MNGKGDPPTILRTGDRAKPLEISVAENEAAVYYPLRGGYPDGSSIDGEIVGTVAITAEQKRQGWFAMKVAGDSMSPILLHDDIVLFRPFVNGEAVPHRKPLCVFVETWAECVVKYAEVQPDGGVLLISENKDYATKRIDPRKKFVKILGVYAELRRR
jgi:phage repressor protein C with HTH and peptisase S24 domain